MSRRIALLLLPVVVLVCAWPTLGSDEAEDLFDRGRELMADRQYDGAVRTFTSLAKRFPHAAEADEALLLLGKAHLYARHHDRAVATFERLLTERTGSAWAVKARLLMADAYTASGRHDLAADILKRRLETVEGRAYKLMLAEHYLQVAGAAFEGVPSKDPMKKGEKERDLTKAVAYFIKARTLLEGEREEGELTVKIARAWYDANNPKQVVETLKDFFKRFEDFADPAGVRLLEARAYQQLGQTALARAELKDFVAADGLFRGEADRPEALALLAETWFKEGGDRAVLKGVAVLASAIQAYPEHALAEKMAYRIGNALFLAGKLKEAALALAAFPVKYPKSDRVPDAQLELAEAHYRMKDYAAARATWRTFIADNPNHPRWATAQRRIVEALFTAAADLRKADQAEKAITAFQAFLAEYPADKLSARAQENVAELHENAERFDAALEAYRIVATRYAALDPAAAARSQFKRAEILRLKKEDLDGTMKALKDLLKRFPRTGEALRALQLIARLGARSLKVETERVFALCEQPRLEVATRNLEKLDFKAYPIDLVEYFRKKNRIDQIESVEVPIIKPALAWTETTEGYARYKDIERRVDLERLKALAPKGGAFILAVRGDDLETRTLVILSDLTVVLKKSPLQALAFVLDEASGRPAGDVEILVSNGRKLVGTGKTDHEGVFIKRFGKYVADLRVLAHRDGHVAFAGGTSPSAYTFGYKTKVYLYTDRPRYRPGHTVEFKGIARRVEEGVYRTPKNREVEVKVLDSRGAVLLDRRMKTNAFGTFSGEVAVGTAAPLGTYRVTARFDRLDFDTTFEVAEYKKPDMFVRVKPGRPDYLNGERIKATLEAGYFFGGPAKRAAVTWRVFRAPYAFDATAYQDYAWFFEEQKTGKPAEGGPGDFVASGQGTTDPEGRLEIAFDTGDKEGDWRYTVVAEAQGRGRSVAYGSSVLFVTERAYYTIVRADKKAYQPAESIRVSVTTVNARHEPVARTGQVALVRLGRGKRGPTETVTASAAVTTGEDGKGEVELKAPRGGDYLIRFTGEDRRKEKVIGQARVVVAGEAEDLSRQAKIVAEREIYYAGDKANVLINTPEAPAWALLTFEGERVLDHRVVRLERRSNLLKLEMKGEYSPNVFLRVAIPAKHKLHEDEDEVLVFKFLKVAVTPDRSEYRPGDPARFTIQASDPKGKPVKTELSLAVVDRSLLEIAPETTKNIKPFFYDQKRRRSVNTSSSLTFKYAAQTRKVDPDLLGIEAREKLGEELRRLQEQAKELYATKDAAPAALVKMAIDKGFDPGTLGRPSPEKEAKLKAKAPSAAVGLGGGAAGAFGRRADARKRRANADKKAHRLAEDAEEMELEDSIGRDVRGRAEQLFADADAPAEGAVAFGRGLMDLEIAANLAAVKVRQRFLDTAAFLPHVETDEAGKAEVEVVLPDNLTARRTRAVGVGGDALVGSGEAVFKVSKPLVVRIDAPRFLTQGDRVRAASVLHNNTREAQKLTVELALEGARLDGASRAAIELEPWEAGRLDWDLTAPDPGAVKFTCKATEARPEGARDGMELGIPSLPFGVHGRTARSATTEESATLTITLPDRLVADACTVNLLLSPGYDAVILDSLDYLEGFPYGCLEQTVSRFLPAVVAYRALGQLGIFDPGRADRLEKRIRAGLSRLYHMQHPDGGWGWWHLKVRGGRDHGGSDPHMTAYALLGLEIARSAGYAVDENVLGKARRRARDLARRVAGYDLRAALWFALSINGNAGASELGGAYRYRDLLGVGGLARLAVAYAGQDRRQYAENLVTMLEERARRSGSHVWWPFAARDRGQWDRSALENTAYALMAILAVKPDSELVEPALAYLMYHRKGRAFRSTKDTAAVLMALTAYLKNRGLEKADYDLAVEVNGQEAAAVKVRGGRIEGASRLLTLDAKRFQPGPNTVRLLKNGPGRMHYAFIADHYEPAETVTPAGNLLKVMRAYRRHADPEERGEDWVKPGWTVVVSKFRPAEKAEPDIRELVAGQKARVELALSAREPLAYLVVEDPLPAGFEVLPGSAQGAFDRFEQRDDRAVFFLSSVKEGTAKVSYVIRAIHPGDYRARPTFAAPMYEPEIWARGASASFKVHDPDATGANLTEVKREPTADELYYGALNDLKKKRMAEALEKLRAVRKFRLKDDILDNVLAELVRLELDKAPKDAVSAYERLRERNPRKAAFGRAARIRLAHAYHGLRESERAAGIYRQLLSESFERERAIVNSYVELGQPARAQDVLLTVLRRYPDANTVVSAFYRRGLTFAEIRRPELERDPYLKTGMPTMRIEALRDLKAFTGFYPESALADDAQYHIVKLFEELKNHPRAVAEAKRFYQRYPKSPWRDDVMFLELRSLYADGKYDAALEAGRTLTEKRFPREDGGNGTAWSPWRDHTLYLFGKIRHIQGDLTQAVNYYRRVAKEFEDARDALIFFTRTELSVKPTVSVPLDQEPAVEVTLKNQRRVKVKIYPVDLKVLFAVRKNLSNVNAIDLTGIPAVATFERKVVQPLDYVRFTRRIALPIKEKGVYLVVLKAGDLDTSTVVVRSDLDIKVQRVGQKVRAYVSLRSSGAPVAGALVRIADGRQIKAEGRTDPRGVFEGPHIGGKASIVVEHGGSFAFFQEGMP